MRSKIILKYPAKETGRPLIYELVKKYNLSFNILKANINTNMEGSILLDVEGDALQLTNALEYIHSLGVEADLITSTLDIDRTKCVECGLCTSVCKSRALKLNTETWSLEFDPDLCISCNRCIPLCPARALSTPTGHFDV